MLTRFLSLNVTNIQIMAQVYNDESVELHDTLVVYALKNISRDFDGHIKFPLLWNGQVSHHLGKNKESVKINSEIKFEKA